MTPPPLTISLGPDKDVEAQGQTPDRRMGRTITLPRTTTIPRTSTFDRTVTFNQDPAAQERELQLRRHNSVSFASPSRVDAPSRIVGEFRRVELWLDTEKQERLTVQNPLHPRLRLAGRSVKHRPDQGRAQGACRPRLAHPAQG